MSTDVPREITHSAVQGISTTTQLLAMQNKTGNPFDLVFLTLVAAGGSLAITSGFVGIQEGRDVSKATTDQTLLFSALLFGASASLSNNGSTVANTSCVDIHFGPAEVIKAAEWFEQITGEKPDKYLNPGLVKAFRDHAEEANQPLGDFLSKRPPTPKTLN